MMKSLRLSVERYANCEWISRRKRSHNFWVDCSVLIPLKLLVALDNEYWAVSIRFISPL